MKKLLVICATLALLLFACPALAGTDSAVDALLEQLDAFLSVSEQLFAAQADTLQRVSDFCDQHSYASLLRARIACDRAQQTISALTAPALLLSDEAFAALMDMGVETDALEAELLSLADEITDEQAILARLETMLGITILSRDQTDILARQTALNQQCAGLLRQYLCAMVNYLLLPVAHDAQTSGFWASFPQRYPTLGSAHTAWEPDGEALVTRAVQALDSYAALNSQLASLQGENAYVTSQHIRTLQADDPDALRANALVIDGMPTMAPLPVDWLYPEHTTLSVSGEAPDALPETITVQDTGVTLDACCRYIDQLLSFGAELVAREGSDAQGWRFALTVSGQALAVLWLPDGRASVEYGPGLLSLEESAYICCFQ